MTLARYFNELEEQGAGGNAVYSESIMVNALGFAIRRSLSNVSGMGVFVSFGRIKKGSLVSIYPGATCI